MAYDIIIVGSGVAGYGAAMYAGRLKMRTLLIGEADGGTIVLTDDIENYPGFKKIKGMELSEKLKDHAKQYGVEMVTAKVTEISREDNFRLKTKDNEYESRSVILATGTEWRKLEVPGEEEFSKKGVHYCALCDGYFYADKEVIVVGGSDSAVKEAILLASYARKVYIVYRRDKLRAEPITLERLNNVKNIEVIYNTNIKEIKGGTSVNSVVLDRPYNNSPELAIDGVFVAIGHIPLSGLARQLGVTLNDKAEIIIDRESRTNVEGVFAAGDVVDSKFKQAITGVAEGVNAAHSAYEYLSQ